MCSQIMNRAYEVSIKALREKMRRDDPAEDRHLQEVPRSDVIVVKGQYDCVQDVLRAMEIPYNLVEAEWLDRADLSPSQVVFINCPGNLGRRGLTNIRNFVMAAALPVIHNP